MDQNLTADTELLIETDLFKGALCSYGAEILFTLMH